MSSHILQQLIWYIGIATNSVPVLLGIGLWYRMNLPVKLIWGTFVFSVTLSLSSILIAYVGGSTHWLFYAGPIVYALLFGWAYGLVLRSLAGQIMGWLTALLPAVLVVGLILVDGVQLLNLYAYALLDGLLIVVTILWFRENMHNDYSQSLRDNPWFWFSISILIYWGYSFLTSFFEGALFAYNQQLFGLLFFGVSPFMMILHVVLVVIGFRKLRVDTRTVV